MSPRSSQLAGTRPATSTRLRGVRFQAFGARQRGNGGGQLPSARAQFLHRDYFQVVGDGEAAAQARRAVGGQNVIGPGGIIARGLGTVRSDEDAAGMADFGSSDASGMLRCSGAKRLRDLDGFVERAHQDDGASSCAIDLRAPRRPWAGSSTGARLHWRPRRPGLGGGQQDGAGVGIVLGLREHVGGEMARIAVGGNDQNFGGSGNEVDADFAREQFLSGGDIDIAGADDAVGARTVRVPKAKAAMACAPPI